METPLQSSVRGTNAAVHKRRKRYSNLVPGLCGNIIRELDVLCRITHPNLVKIYKVCGILFLLIFQVFHEHPHHVDIEMPFYNVNLEQWIKKHNSWSQRCQYLEDLLTQMLDVVRCLHENGIYHMDIKSSNILYRKGKFVLCDPGLCSLNNADTNQTQICTLHCRYTFAVA